MFLQEHLFGPEQRLVGFVTQPVHRREASVKATRACLGEKRSWRITLEKSGSNCDACLGRLGKPPRTEFLVVSFLVSTCEIEHSVPAGTLWKTMKGQIITCTLMCINIPHSPHEQRSFDVAIH